jgi:outer membrane biosynthesis protein TonB
MERTEASGFGIALVGHIALILALKALLDTSGALTPPPAMEVSFAEDVGLVSTAPETEASAPAQGEEPGPAEEAAGGEASMPEPVPAPAPVPEPARTPSPSTPRDRPEEPRRTARSNVPSQPRPQQQQQRPQAQPQRQPQRPAQTQPQRSAQAQPRRTGQPGAGQAPQSRGSRLPSAGSFGDDAGTNTRPAAQMTGQAAADIGSAIQRQVQPCAIRQRPPAPEAREIVTSIRLHLTRDGRLASAPQVVGQAGIDEDNRRYAELVRERAILAFRECSPLRNLPQELYDVPRGWQTFTLRFRFPG